MGIAWTAEGVKKKHCNFTKGQKCQQNHSPEAHQRPWWRGILALASFGLALGFALGVKGLGGDFSILASTASREFGSDLVMVRS